MPVVLRWIGHGGLTLIDVPATASLSLADRMDKYADLPMDPADASLIWLAESTGVLDIITIDDGTSASTALRAAKPCATC